MPKKSAKSAPLPPVEKNGKIILVVEDEEAMGKVLRNKLERQGFDTALAVNGGDAIEKMKTKKFDMALLDLLMPGKDGFAVLTEVASTPNAKTPIFVLTNLGEEETLKKAKNMGARECFTKSTTSLNDLMAKIKDVLGL